MLCYAVNIDKSSSMLGEDGRVDGKISKKTREELAALNRDPTYTKLGGDGQKRYVGYSVVTNSYGELLMYISHITDNRSGGHSPFRGTRRAYHPKTTLYGRISSSSS